MDTALLEIWAAVVLIEAFPLPGLVGAASLGTLAPGGPLPPGSRSLSHDGDVLVALRAPPSHNRFGHLTRVDPLHRAHLLRDLHALVEQLQARVVDDLGGADLDGPELAGLFRHRGHELKFQTGCRGLDLGRA